MNGGQNSTASLGLIRAASAVPRRWRCCTSSSLDSVGVTRQTPNCSQGCPVSNVSSSTVLKALGP
jgi:hypothetical protein